MKFRVFVLSCIVLLFSNLMAAVAPAAPAVATGEIAPEIPSPVWLDGKVHRVRDYRDKKITVLFIFEANQPGIVAMAQMNTIARKSNPAEVAFYGVGAASPDVLKRLYGVRQLPFPVCADHKNSVAKLYRRNFDQLPMAVVIGKDGKVYWRGSIKTAPLVINQVMKGKFDLKERIRVEKFSAAVAAAARAKDYEKALRLVRAEWDSHPEDLSLLSLQFTLLYNRLKRVDDCFKLIGEAHRKLPANPGVYELELQLISQSGRSNLYSAYVNRVRKDFASKPMQLLFFAGKLSALSAKEFRPDLVTALLQTGWQAKFANNGDKARFAVDYAKVMHNYGRIDLAIQLAARAVELFATPQEKNGANAALLYYKKIYAVAQKLKL